jgi:hypothetical protein
MKNIVLVVMAFSLQTYAEWHIPANYKNIGGIDDVKLSNIGRFGLLRVARPTVPAHYHTGIDIVRPDTNYWNQPVFPASKGNIVSIIDDGPFSQIIIMHEAGGKNYWTVYEHLHVREKDIGKEVDWNDTIGWYFNKNELTTYGWQFDHLHFEILKIEPAPVKPTKRYPARQYQTYAITCSTKKELETRQENPVEFLRGNFINR